MRAMRIKRRYKIVAAEWEDEEEEIKEIVEAAQVQEAEEDDYSTHELLSDPDISDEERKRRKDLLEWQE